MKTGTAVQRFAIAFFLLAFAAFPGFAETELDRINRAIQETGAEWTASGNWVTDLPASERKMLLGMPQLLEMIPLEQREAIALGRYNEKAEEGSRANKDWRSHNGHNWVTDIRNQGNCGSCVAFGTIAAIECQLRINSGIWDFPIDLSEQHLFSCGGGSCTSGWTIGPAYDRCINPGVPDEACLPYRASDSNCSQACSGWPSRAFHIQDYDELGSWLFPPTTAEIKSALNSGPVTCSMIVYTDFMYYSEGVYRHVTGDVEGGHAICIVGYDDSQSCWIVKNSWGGNWGEDGFFRIRYGDSDFGRNSTRPIITNIPPTPTPPESSPTPTAAPPSPTATPSFPTETPAPNATNTPIPTYPPTQPYIKFIINQTVFGPRDSLELGLLLSNPSPSFEVDLFIILDIQGSYWFWPNWESEAGWKRISLPDKTSALLPVLNFVWPNLDVAIIGAGFWTTLLDDNSVVAGYDFVPFKYQP